MILLGASSWPNWEDLNLKLKNQESGSSETFAASAKGIEDYFLNERGFNLPSGNFLNLFDSVKDPSSQLREIAKFIMSINQAYQAVCRSILLIRLSPNTLM